MSAVLQRPSPSTRRSRVVGMVVAFLALLSGLALGAPIGAPSASASLTTPIGPSFLQPDGTCPPEGFLVQRPEDWKEDGFLRRVDLVSGEVTEAPLDHGMNGAGYNVLDNYIYGTTLDQSIDGGGITRIHGDGTQEFLGRPVGYPPNLNFKWISGDINLNGRYVVGNGGDADDDGFIEWWVVDMDPTSPTYFHVLGVDGPDADTDIDPIRVPVPVPPTPGNAYFPSPDLAYVGNVLYQHFDERSPNLATPDPDDWVGEGGHLFRLNLNMGSFTGTYVDQGEITENGAQFDTGFGALYVDRPNRFIYGSDNGTGDIYRIDLDTLNAAKFTTGTVTSQNDGARCQNAALDTDFGDAPEIGYGTLSIYDGPRHTAIPGLALGAAADAERDAISNADASGDDVTTSDDEDAFGPGPIVLNSNGPSLAVPYTNTTGVPVTVAGWIDLNGNGNFFDAGERQFVTVAPGAPVNLAWGPANGAGTSTFARFRLYQGTIADPQPLGAGTKGEVEDYPVTLTGSYHVSKSASLQSGATVTPGQQIDYTITVTNDSSIALPASLSDPLGDVLDDASLVAGPSAGSIDAGNVLNWSGTVPAGIGATVTVTYSVVVNGTFGNAHLFNAVQGLGCPPGATTPPCGHELLAGSYTVAKATDVPDGATIAPGQVINYTITVTPTGAIGVPASFTDDLSNVLDDATLIAGPVASGGTGSIDGNNVLSWSGTPTIGVPITVTYGVRVNNAVGDGFLENAVVGNGCAPGTPTFPCRLEQYSGSYTVAKSSSPASGTVLVPGQAVTYTITVNKIGAGAVTGATFNDNLAAVLDDATGPTNITASVGSAAMNGTTLVWTGDFGPGNATATITYTVTVKPAAQLAASDGVLQNGVTGPNCTPTTPGCFTTHPIRAWTVVKTSTPAPGTQVSPGSQIAYRLTISNTGGVAIPDAALTDNLGGVLDDATVTAGPTAGATINAGVLSWASALPVDQVGFIDYTVTLDDYANLGDGTLFNAVAAPEAGCPASPITNPALPGYNPNCSTYHYTPLLNYNKTSNAATPVRPGDLVTYTITVTNTGTAPVPSVPVTDDLTTVLDDATLVGSPTGPGTAPALNGNILTWTGPVNPGTPVVITYTVRVKTAVELGTDTGDGVLRNAAVIPRTACVDGQPACPPNENGIDAWTYHKTSDPAPGTVVEPGDQITYTIVIANTGGLALTNRSVADDMSDVLDDAELTAGPTVRAGGNGTVTPPDANNVIRWTGNLGFQEVVYVDYTVTLRPAYQLSANAIISNLVTTTSGGECRIPPCKLEHETKAWDVLKQSDATDVVPGATVNYTITVTNKGSEAVPGATFADDLSDVVDDATFDPTTLEATDGDATFDEATSTITWTGDLAIDQVVVITYSVKVNKPFSGNGHLDNAVFTPDGPCEAVNPIPDRCLEELPGKQLTIVKTTDPEDLEYARPGDVVWYTVTITNTGELDYPTSKGDVAAFEDDLSDVLDDADGPTPAQITVTGPGAAAFDEGTGILSWSGPLVVDEEAVVRYAITVHDDITGDANLLNVVASSTPGSLCPDPPITDPEAAGYDPNCVRPLPLQAYEVAKTSDPADGTTVMPGDRVTYTITITSTGEADYDALAVTDDLSAVLDDATLDGDIVASAGSASVTGTTLTWEGALPARDVVTVTYSVIVKPAIALGDGHIDNLVTGSENFECKPAIDQDEQCETNHDVAAYSTVKEVVSPDKPMPGDQVTYRITITSTGTAPIIGETITDDLSGVLDDGLWDNTAAFTASDPATTGAFAFNSPILSWTGDIAVDDVLVITYSVTLNPTVTGDAWLRNHVVSNDCPALAASGSFVAFANTAMPPNCQTETPEHSVVFAKTVSPAGPFKPGDVVTYTITATNNGQANLDGITFSDDLTRVLDDAELNGAPSADRGAVSYSVPLVNWAGSLAVGEVARVSYSVTVKEQRGDGNMPNGVVGVGPASNCPAVGAAVECQTLSLVLPAGVDLDPTDPGELPRTGGNTSGMVIIGSMLLAAGVGLVAVRRRRRSITS